MFDNKINWWHNGWIYLIEVICFLASNIFIFNLSYTFSSKNKNPIILILQILVDQVIFYFSLDSSQFWQFLRFFLFLLTLEVLRIIG